MTSRDDRSKSPVDQWFEVFVYAPLGFALDARQLFPRFVDRGRNQVVLARVIGKYAVQHGQRRASSYLDQSRTQAAAVLQALGLLPEEAEPSDEADVVAFEAGAVHFEDDEAPEDEGARPTVEHDDPPPGRADDPAVTPADLAGAAADLAIPEYDTLSASQVVPRLGGLSPEELEAVRRYEAANRGRKTILGRIAQLQSA
jgi:hypothetical protein